MDNLEVSSPAFSYNQAIPRKYTCDGEDLSPPLNFQNIPTNTKTIAIIMDDPDAPSGTFDHWIAWNIPPSMLSLPEGAKVPKQGTNHFGKVSYKGPCPPKGKPHHYHIKIYALSVALDLPDGASKEELEQAMQGKILSQGKLIGTYQR